MGAMTDPSPDLGHTSTTATIGGREGVLCIVYRLNPGPRFCFQVCQNNYFSLHGGFLSCVGKPTTFGQRKQTYASRFIHVQQKVQAGMCAHRRL